MSTTHAMYDTVEGAWPLIRRQRFTDFVNISGEEIPAYAALEIVSVDSDLTVYVTKPTKNDANFVLINGRTRVPVGEGGSCTNHMPTWAYYNAEDGEPENGDTLGTRAGFWSLHLGYEGFLVWGGVHNNIVFVQRDMMCREEGGGYYQTERGPVTLCDCEICCLLTATISVNDGSDNWTEPVEVSLTCGGTITDHTGYCCLNDEVEDDTFCFKIENTYEEKVDEIHDDYVLTTRIWSSGDFEINGETYRFSYFRAEYANEEASSCQDGWLLQKWVNTGDPYGTVLQVVDSDFYASNPVYGGWVGATIANIFKYSNDNPYSPDDCPEGFSYNGGDLSPGYGCATYPPPSFTFGGRQSSLFGSCPVFHWSESWFTSVLTPTCEQKKPCARISVIDKCSPQLPCSLETSMYSDRLEWVVDGCGSGSGTHEFVGDACSEFWMFNAGTAGFGWEGADTSFDGQSPPGTGFDFAQFCDSEGIFWINTETRKGYIECALCCYFPEDGEPYIAAYARLHLMCYSPPLYCGESYYAFKTRDLDITFENGELVVSFTGLSPFSMVSTDSTPGACPCECDSPPVLSLKWRCGQTDCS